MKKFKMPDYDLFKSINEKNKKLYEMSLSSYDIKNIVRLKETGDIKKILNIINIIIDKLKDEIKLINFNDIDYLMFKDDHIITLRIFYTPKIEAYLQDINRIIIDTKSDKDILIKLFGREYYDLNLEIDININQLNKIDIINELPIFVKGIGLGKKIYKKIIKDFDFISSYEGYEPSFDSNAVWESLVKDSDLYTFTNDNNFITFYKNVDYKIIIEKLEQFFKIKGQFYFDQDFIKKYGEIHF